MKAFDLPIIVKANLPADKETVWNAITEIAHMRQWFFDNIPAFEPRVGSEVTFDVVAPDKVFPHVWKIIEVDPGNKIVYDWSYGDAFPGRAHVVFELKPVGEDQTEIILTNIIVEDFAQDIPEFERASCEGGWKYFIQDRLFNYIASL